MGAYRRLSREPGINQRADAHACRDSRSAGLLILIATITTALALRLGPFKLMGGGAVIGVLRGQLPL